MRLFWPRVFDSPANYGDIKFAEPAAGLSESRPSILWRIEWVATLPTYNYGALGGSIPNLSELLLYDIRMLVIWAAFFGLSRCKSLDLREPFSKVYGSWEFMLSMCAPTVELLFGLPWSIFLPPLFMTPKSLWLNLVVIGSWLLDGKFRLPQLLSFALLVSTPASFEAPYIRCDVI